MNVADIYSELLGKLALTSDYIGLIDSDENTMQVMYQLDTDQYWLEVIDEAQQGSHGRFFTFDEITDVFKSLPEKFSTKVFSGLKFNKWKDFNKIF